MHARQGVCHPLGGRFAFSFPPIIDDVFSCITTIFCRHLLRLSRILLLLAFLIVPFCQKFLVRIEVFWHDHLQKLIHENSLGVVINCFSGKCKAPAFNTSVVGDKSHNVLIKSVIALTLTVPFLCGNRFAFIMPFCS